MSLDSLQLSATQLPVVLLSHRKYALTLDNNFTQDLLNFPGHTVRVAKRPEELPYAD